MQCAYCYAENDPISRTCSSCGKPLTPPAPAAPKKTRLYTCRRCGNEQPSGFCRKCGEWNGRVPGQVITISVFMFVTAGLLLLVAGLFLVIGEDDTPLWIISIFLAVTGSFYLLLGINLLRLKQWAAVATKVICIIAICASALQLILAIAGGTSFSGIVSTFSGIGWNVFLLIFLGNIDYVFTNRRKGQPLTETGPRQCAVCGNEDLTSFDRVCPKCKKPLASGQTT